MFDIQTVSFKKYENQYERLIYEEKREDKISTAQSVALKLQAKDVPDDSAIFFPRFFFFLVKPLTRMVERDHAINKFLCLRLTFLLIVFSFIVEETSGESFPLEQRCSSFGLGGNGAATE